jgi:hypothetical protein
MGLHGYEGEFELWNVPKVNVYHILCRIKHEMQLVRERTGKDFYVFGTSKKFLEPRRKLIENYGNEPVDILFTVNLSDLAGLGDIEEEPCPDDLKASSKGWRKVVDLENRRSKSIPEEIHTWGSPGRRFYGLSIAKFQYFSPKQERYLRGKHLFYYLHGSPLKSWSQFTMGTLYVDPRRRSRAVRDRRILATAKLEYPYVYEIKKR